MSILQFTTVTGDCNCCTWSAASGDLISSIQLEHGGRVRGIAYRPDGREFITVAEDASLNIVLVEVGPRTSPTCFLLFACF